MKGRVEKAILFPLSTATSFTFCFFWDKFPESDTEEEEDDTIHMGNAIMTFYAALIDLLGRCAPEMHVSLFGGLRAAILMQSSVPDIMLAGLTAASQTSNIHAPLKIIATA